MTELDKDGGEGTAPRTSKTPRFLSPTPTATRALFQGAVNAGAGANPGGGASRSARHGIP